jgi:hypothetical protein
MDRISFPLGVGSKPKAVWKFFVKIMWHCVAAAIADIFCQTLKQPSFKFTTSVVTSTGKYVYGTLKFRRGKLVSTANYWRFNM